jgi:signal transduction histidine kinase
MNSHAPGPRWPKPRAALASARAECARALAQADAARRKHHAFLAGLAHDLRNPLAPLANGIELMRLTDADAAGGSARAGIMERSSATSCASRTSCPTSRA